MSADVLFPMSGDDRIPDEIRSHLDHFILFLAAGWGDKDWGVPHDVVSIKGFGFLHASNQDCFEWSFAKPLCVYTTASKWDF